MMAPAFWKSASGLCSVSGCVECNAARAAGRDRMGRPYDPAADPLAQRSLELEPRGSHAAERADAHAAAARACAHLDYRDTLTGAVCLDCGAELETAPGHDCA